MSPHQAQTGSRSLRSRTRIHIQEGENGKEKADSVPVDPVDPEDPAEEPRAMDDSVADSTARFYIQL